MFSKAVLLVIKDLLCPRHSYGEVEPNLLGLIVLCIFSGLSKAVRSYNISLLCKPRMEKVIQMRKGDSFYLFDVIVGCVT